MYIYPSKGQSQQQQKDEQDCHQWAQQQSGVNPQQIAEQATSLTPISSPKVAWAERSSAAQAEARHSVPWGARSEAMPGKARPLVPL
jgi:hypothetical protein